MFFIGVSGSVAAGKTTFANSLKSLFAGKNLKCEVISLDDFLYPNEKLIEKKLFEKKGFPESYNINLFIKVLNDIKQKKVVKIPTYSHTLYDIVPNSYKTIKPSDIYIFEGVIGLQKFQNKITLSDEFHFSFFLDSKIKNIKKWYLKKVLLGKNNPNKEPDNFFKQYENLSNKKFKKIALKIWDDINQLNYNKYILPTKKYSTFVIKKTKNHNYYL